MQRGTRSHLESWVPLSIVADFTTSPLGDGEFSETLLQEAARLGVDLEIVKERGQASFGGVWIGIQVLGNGLPLVGGLSGPLGTTRGIGIEASPSALHNGLIEGY